MNGRAIDDIGRIGLANPPAGWHLLIPGFNVYSALSFLAAISVFEIKESSVLRDLLREFRYATIHPWARIHCPEADDWVVTEDGVVVHVEPRTRQLFDPTRLGLFDTRSGLPILFHGDDIVTTNLIQQRVENGVLRDAVTTEPMLEAGIEFHMAIIATIFGDFDVPVRNLGTPENPDWRLMNGDSADGTILPMRDVATLNTWTGFWEGIRNLFGGGSGWSIWRILQLILVILIVILLLPIFFMIFKVIWFVVSFVIELIPKRQKTETRTNNRGRR